MIPLYPPMPLAEFSVDNLRVLIYQSREDAGGAAATEVARKIRKLQTLEHASRIVFAAAPSQDEFLAHLVRHPAVDWSRVTAFHMDEYLGLPPDHPAAFRRYLAEHLFRPAGLESHQLRLIPGEKVENPLQVCLDYSKALTAEPPHIVCAGIGENGHLAFNDPPADFLDPLPIKVVRLDEACRQQQVNDECFARLADVPTHAFTLTVSALFQITTMSIVVPGARKAEAVRLALKGPVTDSCPASILRTHPDATLYLDRDSSRLLG